MALNDLIRRLRLWSGASRNSAGIAESSRRSRRRTSLLRSTIAEFESRTLLAANYLYSLEARPGVPDDGFGFSLAANDQFHVVTNFAPYVSPLYLENYPDYFQDRFYGEIQVHDATTGDLLRTIQNPLPYGHPYFNNLYGFDNAYVTPNAFGYSIDISEDLILVGSPGWDSRFVPEPDNNDSETGGRAFLFDANTGDLLHTFDGSFVPTGTQGRNNDGFGRSVAIDGDRIIIGAPGPSYFDEEEQIWDTDSGHVYIYSATTGNLLHMLESPDPSPEETLDYGAMVSVSDGKLVVTQGSDFGYETFGPTLVYDVQSGDLLHTLSDGGGLSHPAVIVGNVIAVGHSPGITDFYNAATGTLTQTINDRLLAFDGNLIVTQSGSTTGLGDIADLAIRDFPSGNVLYNVPAPPNFVEAIWGYNQIPQLSGDRLLIPGRQGTATHDVVFVYSVTDGVTNSPPIDMALSNNSIAENSLSNSTIGTLSAADPDAPETFSFSLLNDANARFEIVGNQLRVQTGTLLNFEVATSHSITVRVTDSAGNTFDKAFTIQVTNVNETPTDIALSNNFVPETAPANAVIGTFSTVDPDSPETHIYDLLDNAGGRFQVSGSMLRVADNSLLDYETSTSHQISVRVTDSAGNQRTEQFVIQVVNVNEATPTDIGLSGSVVSESVVRTVHSTAATGTLFGADIAANGDRMLVAEAFGTFPNIEYKVHVLDAETGAPLRTLTVPSLDPLASDPDGRFGQTLVVSGSRAYVGAYSTRVGNLDEAGVVYVFDIPTGNLLLTLNSPTPTTMGFFGSSLAISGNVLAVSAINEATGTVYLFHATTGQLLETVVNPTPTPLAAFGQSFAMNGDTLVIGSRFEDIGASNAGRAYIYEFDSATSIATLVHTLNNPSPADDERFGDSVAVSGNLVAVKDSTSVGSDTNVGSVHLFDRVTGAYLRTLTNPTPGTTDQFGSSLTISGDFVIANSNSDIGGLNNGRAYVFQASTGALLATIKNPSPNANDEFASKLALAGNRIVASAVRDDTDGNNRGLVYVFDLAIGQTVGTLSATDTDLGETFTYSLLDDADGRFAIDGDQLVIADATKLDYETATSHNVTVQVLDSVGHAFSKSLVISVSPRSEAPSDIALPVQPIAEGAVRTLHNLTNTGISSFGYQTASDGILTVVGHNNLPVSGLSGQVSVFNNVTGELVSLLSSPTGDVGELFGERVAISGNTAIVSARLNDTSGVDAGVVYVFDATSGDLLHTLVNPSPSNTGGGTDQFGFEVAISGNLIAIGSQDDLGTTDSGAVHLYNATSGTLLQTLANPTPLNQSRFGQSLSLEGQTLVVGASSTNQTYVYTFNPASQTAALTATLSNVGGGTLELFGKGIGQVGDFVAVGAHSNDSTGTNSGRVLIYNRNTGSFLRVIDNPTPAIEDNFGQFISGSSTTGLLAISAQGDDTGATDAGSVYLFDPATGNLVTIIHNPSPNAGDFFTRISWGGARLIVGAPTDDTDGGNLGQVYVYEPLLQNVGTLSATDPDTGDSLTFALVDDANGRFFLQGTTIIADRSKIDSETATSHQIIVQVTDASGLSTQEAYLIPITNIQESPFDIQFTPSSVNENAPNGTIVSTLSTLDPEGDSVTYTMLDSAGGRFTIQGNQIVVANGSLLDYETTTSHRVRVRVTDATGQNNVESRLISVNDQANEIDFGDLPNTFGTTLASNGARHAFGGDLRFGNTITGEANGQPSANANLDSGDDGVFLPQVLIPGHEALIRFAMPIVGQIDGFIDFDNSGSFQASERVTSSGQTLPLVNGLYELTISVPITAIAGNVGARFRISSAGGLGPLGSAPNGEVEDYRVSIAAKTSGTVQVLPDPMQTGGSFMFVNGGSGNDKIIVAPANGGLRATINGVNKLPIAPMTVFKIIIHGHAGKDDIQINGTTVSGQIDGGTQDDTIRGGLGHDVIYGRAGNDKLYGGDGMDTQYGGDGNDLMNSEGGVGYMFGENGKDIMTGNGVLVGGAGNDTLYGSGSRNLLIGGTGKDKLNGANSNQGDLIVSGSTAYDNNPTQLAVFRFIWDSPAPVLDRITSISNGIPTSSGLIALNNTTVFPDPQVDQIFNFGSNIPILNDWIFKSNNDIKSSPLGIVTVI